jgi:ribokinase
VTVPTVLCAGHVNWDVTLCLDRLPAPDGEARILDQQSAGGGSAANVATGLATLGVETALFGSVGTDENGHLVRRALDDAGVDCVPLVTVDADTTVKYLLVGTDGEVMVLGNDGANESYAATDLADGTLSATDHLHLTNQDPATARRLAERAVDAGATVSVDPGRRAGERDFTPTLALADVVFYNEREAPRAADRPPRDDPPGYIRVVTRGADGAAVDTPDGSHWSRDGVDVDSVDTTGAGDAFAAGFLSVVLGTEDPDYDRALTVGNACGALATRERGARVRLDPDAVRRLSDAD